jgi:hypothetical protein
MVPTTCQSIGCRPSIELQDILRRPGSLTLHPRVAPCTAYTFNGIGGKANITRPPAGG